MIRAALVLLLWLPAAAFAQEPNLDKAVSALVRISGTRGDTPVRGSGFVIGLDRDKATIVTASHVIEGVQQFEVTFAADPTESFPAGAVLGIETGNPRGLAAFQVRGALPAGATTLGFEIESRPGLGDELFLVGFPQMEPAPRTPRRVLSGRRGTLLLIDQGIGEGFSGGPVLQGGKVVGVVTDTDDQTTYAVGAVVVREALEGWRVAPAVVERCEPGKIERDAKGIDFVHICPGTFTMGSAETDQSADNDEKPSHQVTLSKEFWIGKTEFTNEQYRRVKQNHQGEDELPVTDVNWNDAKGACESFGGRLPTEAEWEYAARAGSKTAWSFGNDETLLANYAWYEKNAGNEPHPVAKKEPNDWGLHDMHGNVVEWVADRYAPYTVAAQRDPDGPTTGEFFEYRVLRGGAFDYLPRFLRSADRNGGQPEDGFSNVGFRCARNPVRHP